VWRAQASAAQGTAPQHGFSATGPGRRQILGPSATLSCDLPNRPRSERLCFDEPGGIAPAVRPGAVRPMLIMVSMSAVTVQRLRSLDDEGLHSGRFERHATGFLTDFFVFWIVIWLPAMRPGWLHQKVAEKRATPGSS
jgi:hypothetical protein